MSGLYENSILDSPIITDDQDHAKVRAILEQHAPDLIEMVLGDRP